MPRTRAAALAAAGLLLGLLLQAPGGARGWTYKEVKAVCGAEGEPKPCRKLAVDGLAADGAALKPCWWKWQQPPGCKARSKKKLTQLGAVFGQATPPPPAAAPPPADDAWPAAAAWETCGGLNHPCETDGACAACLDEGFECVPTSKPWHYMCDDKGSGGGSAPAPEPAPEPSPEPTPEPAPEPAPPSGGGGGSSSGEKGSARTTRYFDGCKPSCGWASNIADKFDEGDGPVNSCTGSLGDGDTQDAFAGDFVNVCGGGGDGSRLAYGCLHEAPFTKDGQRYGFAAAPFPCCRCYELTFTGGPVKGKTMIVQVTNTGFDLSNKHFDLHIPGGGFGLFNGVVPDPANNEPVNGPAMFPSSSVDVWGQRYGGVSSIRGCDALPPQAQPGCKWRFEATGLAGADNPPVDYKRVKCPSVLTKKSGCVLKDDA